MYTETNYRTKKALKADVTAGKRVACPHMVRTGDGQGRRDRQGQVATT